MRFLRLVLAGLSLECAVVRGDRPWHKSDRSEISYVTRPDLRPQKLNVTTYKPHLVTPGYFFISPYGRDRDSGPSHSFMPAQTGPHIYDGQGDLIWSGAYDFDQRSSYNLDVATYKGEQVLTFSVREKGDGEDVPSQRVTGVIMDTNYKVVKEVMADNGKRAFNMHEFNVVDDGAHALVILIRGAIQKHPDGKEERIEDNGFQDIDTATGKTVFEWWAHEHVPISWIWKDPYHINAVDKTADGNYLVSIRHLSTVYLISGQDGSIIWQLGKEKSSFQHVDGFTFRYQHHVRVHDRNATHTTISFLDNNSWEGEQQPKGKDSAGVLVSLSTATTPMTATLVRAWKRPDNINAYRRGSVQVLPNGQCIVAWGERAYMSEFTWDGELVQEVRYQEPRFDDYRAYKLNFTGFSNEPIAIVSQVYGAANDSIVTGIYVSWNGATQVKGWNFYEVKAKTEPTFLGYQKRTGFETTFMVPGFHGKVYAEAIRLDGKPMQKSRVETTKTPSHFSDQQHEMINSWIQENQVMLEMAQNATQQNSTLQNSTQLNSTQLNTTDSSSLLPEMTVAVSSGLSGVGGLILGIAGTCVAFCLARRRENNRGAWSRVQTTAEEADDLEEELEKAEAEAEAEERAGKSGGPEEAGQPLLKGRDAR